MPPSRSGTATAIAGQRPAAARRQGHRHHRASAASEVRPFSDAQVKLLQTFADQAVIAIENVRLFKELETKNRDLTETLEQQTATGEVLRVISASPTDVQPVFDTIARNAARLCEAQFCFVYRYDGRLLHFVAHHGSRRKERRRSAARFPRRPAAEARRRGQCSTATSSRSRMSTRIRTSRSPRTATVAGYRSAIGVPMLRDGLPIGSIAVARSQAGLLPDRQVDLLKTFADQAVIAIENVRLFQELEARTEDLTRSVGELRALGEVSQAVSSTLDLDTVLATIVARAVELSGSYSGIIYEFDESTQTFGARASHNLTPEYLAVLRASPIHLGEGAMGRAGALREPVEVSDVQDEGQARRTAGASPHRPARRAIAPRGAARTGRQAAGWPRRAPARAGAVLRRGRRDAPDVRLPVGAGHQQRRAVP